MKRLIDVTASAIGLVLLAPVLALIALSIVFTSGLPVVYRQQRVGRNGVPFTMLKFRSMVNDAGLPGALITVGGDPRVTAVGRFLRRHKLDELPQLINVLRGDMSIVGPRPEVSKYVDLYTPEQRRVLELSPGITDPASVRYLHEEDELAAAENPEQLYRRVIMPEKIRINLEYAEHSSTGSDLGIVLRTIFSIGRNG